MHGMGYFEAGILGAIYRGVDTVEGLKELFNTVDPGVVEEAVRRLEYEGYIRRERRGLLFKRERLVLTERGVRALDEAMKTLREAASKLENASRHGIRPEEVVGWEILALAPLLLMMGLIPPVLAHGLMAGEYGGEEWDEDSEGFDVDYDADFGDAGF